jgi:hypothetical protein
MSNSTEKLKRSIVRILGETASGKAHSQQRLEQIAEDVLKAFKARVNAPANRKHKVWAEGEQRILRELRSRERGRLKATVARAKTSSHSSA